MNAAHPLAGQPERLEDAEYGLFRREIMRQASFAFARAAEAGRTTRRPAPMPFCACGCQGEQHDQIGDTSDCLNTRCPENCTEYRPQAPAGVTIAAPGSMYTSEPLQNVQGAFHTTDGRYWGDIETARRAQKHLDELVQLEAHLTVAGDAASDRLSRRIA